MTYRESELVERCTECDARADRHCPRCARPICGEHEVDADGLCTPCEVEYLSRPRQFRGGAIASSAVIVPGALLSVALLGPLGYYVAIAIGGATFGAVGALTRAGERRRRRAFVGERKPRELPMAR